MEASQRTAFTALAFVLAAAVVGCGGNDSVSPDEANQQAKQAAQNARQQEKIKQLEKDVKEQKQQPSSSSSDSAPGTAAPVTQQDLSQARDCGNVLAGPNTSCEFAQNVANDYNASGGSSSFSTYSPVTGQTYQMTCAGSSPVVCTGGNNATVYFP